MKTLKKSLGILASALLVFGLLTGTALSSEPQTQAPPPQQNLEEFWAKLAQNLALMNLSFRLELEKEAVNEIISGLEKFQTDDAAIKEKIGNNWLPTFKEYQKVLENLIQVVEKFFGREDLIPNEEIETELLKYYSDRLFNAVLQALREMEEIDALQKILQE